MVRAAARVSLLATVLAAAALAAGCTSGSSPHATASGGTGTATPTASATTASASPSATPAAADWPTYHRTADRTGFVPDLAPVHRLAPAWRARLDGAVYGQPLVIGDLVVAASENDTVYGLDRATGQVRWRRHLGTPVPRSQLPCGNIDPLGITGTPAYDATSGSVYVVTETTGARHTLVELDAATGAVRRRTSLDVTRRDQRAEQQRGALAVAGGRVYVPFGGLEGDCGNYVGYVTATPVDGTGATTAYAVPTAREGGIWAASGVAVDAAGDVWVAVGNGASTGGRYDGSDSVLRLAPDLSRRLDVFAPSSWGSQNAADQDLGSTGPMLLGSGRVLVSGKDAEVYLLDAARLGGIGGQLARLGGCAGFGGSAFDPTARAAFVPCRDGVLRVEVGSSTLRAGWKAAAAVAGSPVVGAGAVWALDPVGGRLHVLDEATGRQVTSLIVGTTSRFASPVLVAGLVVVPTMSGLTALAVS